MQCGEVPATDYAARAVALVVAASVTREDLTWARELAARAADAHVAYAALASVIADMLDDHLRAGGRRSLHLE
jgi:hypothetical protein